MNSPRSTKQTVVFYPSLEFVDSEAFLQPLVVTVSFPGPVPQHLIHSEIPIEISITASGEGGVMAPVVHASAWATYHSEPADTLIDVNSPTPAASIMDLSIPFLPLQCTFDPRSTRQWAKLSNDIERWLVDEVDTPHPRWEWGLDAFWMAFVGAFPLFPGRKWRHWNPRIPLEGQFIQGWLSGDEGSSGGEPDGVVSLEHTLSTIWEMFCRHVALFYPFPLISTQ
ncbi:hypothetical protein PISMIDRAFT_98524 [Pisolithus microcarpus 441]|uniref:Uncharacterized protein n=1 Tax=Pisolithus microcarpus 441 TaxID=765257 RepID=A0A0C9ZQ57_9AGAM|nr:hypothetical protein PISMIDRAFT_98524 [Pisolithus microcarpus 441]